MNVYEVFLIYTYIYMYIYIYIHKYTHRHVDNTHSPFLPEALQEFACTKATCGRQKGSWLPRIRVPHRVAKREAGVDAEVLKFVKHLLGMVTIGFNLFFLEALWDLWMIFGSVKPPQTFDFLVSLSRSDSCPA